MRRWRGQGWSTRRQGCQTGDHSSSLIWLFLRNFLPCLWQPKPDHFLMGSQASPAVFCCNPNSIFFFSKGSRAISRWQNQVFKVRYFLATETGYFSPHVGLSPAVSGNMTWCFLRRPQDISICVRGDQSHLCFMGSQAISSSVFWGPKQVFFKPNHDVFLTLTNYFLCLNLGKTISYRCEERTRELKLNKHEVVI